MIKREKLIEIARLKGLTDKNAEKDYIQDLLLHYIYKNVSDMFVFKGGTALYKVYSLNRFSEDLDFTLNKRKIDLEQLLKKVFRLLSLINVRGNVEELEDFHNQINARLTFRGPLYDGRKESLVRIILNISIREKAMDEIKKEMVYTVYSEIPEYEVFVMSKEELVAEKIRTVIVRSKSRDVFDLWFLLKRGILIDYKMLERKLQKSHAAFSLEKVEQKIELRRSAWEHDLRGLVIGTLPPFAQVKKEILEKMKGQINN